jgi:hypothetical protein
VSARPIGWASLDEEAREGIDGKVDKAELAEAFVVACEEAWLECEKGGPSAICVGDPCQVRRQ